VLQTLVVVVTIGLGDSVNPSTVGPALYLASGERGAARVLEFMLGAGAIYLVGGAILTLGPGHLLIGLLPNPRPRTRFWIELGAGLALSIVAWIVWVRRRRLAERNARSLEPKRKSAFVLGASIMAVELPSAFPYFAAIAAIVGSGAGTLEQLILLGIFNACFLLPLVLIAAALRLGGEGTQRLVIRGRKLLTTRWPQALAVVLALFGLFVIALGATGLIGKGRGGVAGFARAVHGVISP
jgi:cytochrome c biogenesis protein CcdA